MPDKLRIAIACQGGGSHTAFTAGVLKRIVADDRFEVVALSGTSGGAVCAFLTWYGLSGGDPQRAVSLLDAFWAGTAATSPWDAALNSWLVLAARLEGVAILPAVSPYAYPEWASQRFRSQLEALVSPQDVARVKTGPLLLVGAVDVRSGEFKAFNSAFGEVSIDAVLASAAIPNLFRAVQVGEGAYWDGLFSQNPPVRELPDVKPDAIWVIRINPTTRKAEPTSMSDIVDRRNELAGNLSLTQELYFINKINELVCKGKLKGTKYREIAVDTIEMDPAFEAALDAASKLDRRPTLLADLQAHGEHQAGRFLAGRT